MGRNAHGGSMFDRAIVSLIHKPHSAIPNPPSVPRPARICKIKLEQKGRIKENGRTVPALKILPLRTGRLL